MTGVSTNGRKISPDLSLCQAKDVELAPSWILQSGTIYEGPQARCEDLAFAGGRADDFPGWCGTLRDPGDKTWYRKHSLSQVGVTKEQGVITG
eukprot:s915_g16.t1